MGLVVEGKYIGELVLLKENIIIILKLKIKKKKYNY